MTHCDTGSRSIARAAARTFIDAPRRAHLATELYDALLAETDLRESAYRVSAECFIAAREAWAREIGSVFAESVRRAFRKADQEMRAEMRRRGLPDSEEDAGEGPR